MPDSKLKLPPAWFTFPVTLEAPEESPMSYRIEDVKMRIKRLQAFVNDYERSVEGSSILTATQKNLQ